MLSIKNFFSLSLYAQNLSYIEQNILKFPHLPAVISFIMIVSIAWEVSNFSLMVLVWYR